MTDLPTGWSTTPVTASAVGSDLCGITSSSEHQGSSANVEADFVNGQLPIFDESIAAYTATGGRSFDKLVHLLDNCSSFNDNGSKFTIGQLSFPKVTAQSAAYQISGTSDGLTLVIDLIIAVKSDQVLLAIYSSLGAPDTSQETSFVRMSLARMP